jgi:hypothetical protein
MSRQIPKPDILTLVDYSKNTSTRELIKYEIRSAEEAGDERKVRQLEAEVKREEVEKQGRRTAQIEYAQDETQRRVKHLRKQQDGRDRKDRMCEREEKERRDRREGRRSKMDTQDNISVVTKPRHVRENHPVYKYEDNQTLATRKGLNRIMGEDTFCDFRLESKTIWPSKNKLYERWIDARVGMCGNDVKRLGSPFMPVDPVSDSFKLIETLLATDKMPTAPMLALLYMIKYTVSLRQQWTIGGTDDANAYMTRVAQYSVLLIHKVNANASVLCTAKSALGVLQYEQVFARYTSVVEDELNAVVGKRLNMIAGHEPFDIIEVESLFGAVFEKMVLNTQKDLPKKMQVQAGESEIAYISYILGEKEDIHRCFKTFSVKHNPVSVLFVCLVYGAPVPQDIDSFDRRDVYMKGCRSTVREHKDNPHYLRIQRESDVKRVRLYFKEAQLEAAAAKRAVIVKPTADDFAQLGWWVDDKEERAQKRKIWSERQVSDLLFRVQF